MRNRAARCALRGVLAALVLGVAATAQAQSFAAKPGAWEMNTTMSGAMIPPDVLAQMPPERRAMVEQRMAQGQTRKSCVKKEDLDQDHFMQRQEANCTVKTVSRSPSKLVMAVTCTGERASTGTVTFEAKTPESVIGSIDQERSGGGKMHIGIVGKWLGASCDGIEPMRKQ